MHVLKQLTQNLLQIVLEKACDPLSCNWDEKNSERYMHWMWRSIYKPARIKRIMQLLSPLQTILQRKAFNLESRTRNGTEFQSNGRGKHPRKHVFGGRREVSSKNPCYSLYAVEHCGKKSSEKSMVLQTSASPPSNQPSQLLSNTLEKESNQQKET